MSAFTHHPDTPTPRHLDTLDLLAALVANSLVRYEGDLGSGPRYTMLETIREFALERLAESGHEASARAAPRGLVPGVRRARWTARQGSGCRRLLEALEREHPNLRAALTWLVTQGDGPRLVRLAGALWPFWHQHAHYGEGRRWLEMALDLGRKRRRLIGWSHSPERAR